MGTSAPPPPAPVEEPDTPNSLKSFFADIESTKAKIVIIKTCIQDIKTLHDRALNNVISEQENARNSQYPFMRL